MSASSDVARPSAPRLFLVDGYALIYRAFFALINRPLTTRHGENTSIAWGIANFLKRLLATHRPEYLAWVHDAGASFRDTLYPEYKATREKLADDLQADFDTGLERVRELLRAYDIPIFAVEGYEADDVIGTMARLGAESGLDVVIVSGDKDFHQLVQPRVWLLNPGRGGPAAVDEQWVGMANASDRLGVPPERVVDYLALVGDASDNVPGVKGIGEKGAVELITQFGSISSACAWDRPTVTHCVCCTRRSSSTRCSRTWAARRASERQRRVLVARRTPPSRRARWRSRWARLPRRAKDRQSCPCRSGRRVCRCAPTRSTPSRTRSMQCST
ncbi:MAG: hypothetical protein MUD17_09475 [Gemmatimonadaceae bacterium]|nr:hypothetical protein [Gemmatimonadaceae bacterium]